MPQFPSGQTLLIDADDTLWENNVYFERAIAAFIGYLNHDTCTPEEVRLTLNGVERETILAHGYGLTSFSRSLVSCYDQVTRYLDLLALAYSGKRGECHRLAGEMHARLRYGQIEQIMETGLHEFLTDFIADNARLGAAIAEQYLT